MSDIHTPEIRSFNMSRIKSKGNKSEELVRKYLFSKGLRYRKNDTRLPGKPDIVLPKYKTVIFVNGCFWHKHEGCKYFVWPKKNATFWRNKITGNTERDTQNYNLLAQLGWKVLIIWECELRKDKANDTLEKIVNDIKNKSSQACHCNTFYLY